MPRTAPVPNMVAIPGMNPGTIVAGGGGGAGGGSGGSGKGGKKGKGGDGDGGGEDAEGGGKTGNEGEGEAAAECGAGQSCSSHNATVKKGDPVDVSSGKVTTSPITDLQLGGLIPFTFQRAYSSQAAHTDLGMGHGWGFSFAHRLQKMRRGMVLLKADGSRVYFDKPGVGESAIFGSGYLVQRDARGFVIDFDDGLMRGFTESPDSPATFLLTSLLDSCGNVIRLEYEHDVLSAATDSVGRRIVFAHGDDHRIESVQAFDPIQQTWVKFASYYYDRGDLVRSIDPDGHEIHYEYEHHRLVRYRVATGLTVDFRYDKEGRCRETWCHYGGAEDPCLAPTLPDVLADGSPAKGMLHVKLDFVTTDEVTYTESVDSLSVERFFSNHLGKVEKAVGAGGVNERAYDPFGKELSHTDPYGYVWKTERDHRGRPTKYVDPLGQETLIERDLEGNLLRVTKPGGSVLEYHRDDSGKIHQTLDSRGATSTVRRHSTGLPLSRTNASGHTSSWAYDQYANPIQATLTNGAVWQYEYDGFGRMTAVVQPDGGRWEYGISLKGSRVWAKNPLGHTRRVDFDALGNMVRITNEAGFTTEFLYGGVRHLYEVRRPNGTKTRAFYNREGMVVELQNENGERQTFDYGPTRKVRRETTFDGRELRFAYEVSGRMSSEEGPIEGTTYQYDELGRVVGMEHLDGSTVAIERTPANRIARIAFAGVESSFQHSTERDVTAERQQFDQELTELTKDVGADGYLRSVEATTGYGYAIKQRGPLAEPTELTLSGARIRRDLDDRGKEVRRRLPAGGEVASTYDTLGRLVRRRLLPAGGRATMPREPGYVGEESAVFDHSFAYDSVGELISVAEGKGRVTELVYDPVGRLVRFSPAGRDEERFAYDDMGNPRFSVATVHGAGGKIERKGQTEYRWNDEGKLIEKVVTKDDGSRELWHYEWNGAGWLTKVRRPDRSIVSFRYDGLGRRLEKKLSGPYGDERQRTHYVWNGDYCVEERTATTPEGGPAVWSGKEYFFHETSFSALAHADVEYDSHGQKKARTYYHYLNGPFGFPEALCDDTGRLAATLQRSAFGSVHYAPGARTTTPLRSEGQYYDEETGLSYNRFRYYDAEIASFISPDPLGTAGSLHPYALGWNPISWLDPYGLNGQDRATHARELQQGTPGQQRRTTLATAEVDPPFDDKGPVVVTQSNNGNVPVVGARDPDWEVRSPGRLEGGVTPDQFISTKADRDPDTGEHHAEQRLIARANAEGRKITAISATNKVCDLCFAALVDHNPDMEIYDYDGTKLNPLP